MIRKALPALLLVVPFLVPGPAHATAGRGISVSTIVQGVRLTLSLPKHVYPRNALVRATVRIENVGQRTILTWIGDGCTNTNPFIEVFDGQGRLLDQGPTVTFERAGGCRHVLGQPFPPGHVVVRHIFAVLKGRYLRAVLSVGKNLNAQDVTTRLTVHLVAGAAPAVTIDQSGEPVAVVQRPSGATGPLYYSASALCGTASDPQTSSMDLLWSPVSQRFHSGCLQTREWHGLVGYLNYPVATIDYPAPTK